MFQKSLELIASLEELNGTDLKVFMFLLSQLDFENYIRVIQKRITEHTKIKQQHVSTALTKLTKLFGDNYFSVLATITNGIFWRTNFNDKHCFSPYRIYHQRHS